MGPEVDVSGKLNTTMEVSPVSIKENGNTIMLPEEKLIGCAINCEDHTFVAPVAKTSEENLMMRCSSSYEDNIFHMESSPVDCDQVMASKEHNKDVEVEIVEDVIPDQEMVAEKESLDATENSSSFGCTDSETGVAGASSDVEVESQVRDDNASLTEFDGLSDPFRTRKKKLTAHWRKFIRPLMWRCKWVELHIKELHSQTSKYDHELAEYGRRKKFDLEKCTAEDLAVKSTPSVCQNWPVRVMKRNKRKRVEDTTDLAAYTSCHSLFSYFASKKPVGDSAYLGEVQGKTEETTSGNGEFDVNGDWSFFELKDSDALESILRKIEVSQLHVRQLRSRIDKVVKENTEKFTASNSSVAPGEPLAIRGPSSYHPHVNGKKFPVGSLPSTSQQTSKRKLVMPGSLVSGHREANPLDMIVSTDKIENDILLYSQPVNQDLIDTQLLGTLHTTKPRTGIEVKAENVEHVPDPNSPSKLTVTRDQMTAKIRSKLSITPKNTRKRGRRKARTGKWTRKSSG